MTARNLEKMLNLKLATLSRVGKILRIYALIILPLSKTAVHILEKYVIK